ncbi:MAG: hypothetical protein RL376_1774 [Verrucomicrobiota bacterium]|jgi:acetyl esterase/lipase
MAFVFLCGALALLGVARFSFRPARRYRTWLVALIATELGHFWVLPALTLAVGAALRATRETDFVALAAACLAFAAALLFARPAWCAWRLHRALARDLETSFGQNSGPASPPLWSWIRLWRWPLAVSRVPVRTLAVTPELPVDFYPARGPALPSATGAPCVVIVHGGGWDSGDRTQLAEFNHWLAGHGVAVAAISYRLAPAHPWPAQSEDLRQAVDWLRSQARELGIDRDRLTLVGRSAGGQIAAATAYHTPLPGVRAVVALYAVHDLNFVWSIRSATDSLNSDKLMHQYLGGGPEGREDAYRSGSAEQLVHPRVPPTLLIHGALDQLVWCRHSERLAAALHGIGAPYVFARLPWATHAGEAGLHGPSGQLITGAVLRVALGR